MSKLGSGGVGFPSGLRRLTGLNGRGFLDPLAPPAPPVAEGRPESRQTQTKHHLIVLCDAHGTETLIIRQALCLRACEEEGGAWRVNERRARARRRRAASRLKGERNVVVERGHKKREEGGDARGSGRDVRGVRTSSGSADLDIAATAEMCGDSRVSSARVRVELPKGTTKTRFPEIEMCTAVSSMFT